MLAQAWDQMRQKYGIYLRILEVFPEDRYHTHPIPGLRTPAEMAVHISRTVVRDMAQGVEKGAVTSDEQTEPNEAAGLKTRAALLSFARKCWADADAAVANIGDRQLNAMVPTPWHMTFPGWVGFNIMADEFLHHRGQLSAFARACGVAPPFIWSFPENAPEFRPRQ